MNLALKLIRPLIGKNVPSLARSLATLIGSGLVTIGALEASQVADGVQVGELFQILTGLALVGISRLSSWLRAKEGISSSVISPIVESIGPVVGRSVSSFLRAAMTTVAGWLAAAGLVEEGTTGPQLSNLDIETIISAALVFLLARVFSFIQDKGK